MKKFILTLSFCMVSACSISSNFEDAKQIDYLCGTQKASLKSPTAQVALLKIGEKEYIITQTISASGAKYVNESEKVIFWSKGKEASLEIDNLIYPKCIEENK